MSISLDPGTGWNDPRLVGSATMTWWAWLSLALILAASVAMLVFQTLRAFRVTLLERMNQWRL